MADDAGVMRWLGQDSERGFVVRFVVLALAAGILVGASGALSLTGPWRYLMPGLAALTLAVAYLFRPVESLLVLALFVLFYDTVALWVGASVKQLDEMAAAAIALIAFARAWRSWRHWVWWPRDAGFAVVVLSGVISSLIARVPLTVWLPALVLLVKPTAFLYAVLWTRFRDWEVRGTMRVVLAAGSVVLALGFIQLIDPPAFQRVLGLPEYYRVRGELPVVKSIFVHPALYGWFTALVALFLFAAFLTTRRWAWLFAALAFSLGPILSARRRAILALASGLGAGIVESTRRLRSPRSLANAWWPVAAGSVALVIIFMPALSGLYQLTLDRYIQLPTPSPSLAPGETPAPFVDSDENPQARIALYVGSAKIGRDFFPLGAGLGRYGSWMSRIDYSPLYERYGLSTIRGLRPSNPRYVTDTFWPQILGETGAIGVAGYVVFLGSIGVILWREAGRREGTLRRVLRLGAGLAFTQTLVESVASSMYHSPPRVYLVYMAIGAVMALAWRRDVDGERVEA